MYIFLELGRKKIIFDSILFINDLWSFQIFFMKIRTIWKYWVWSPIGFNLCSENLPLPGNEIAKCSFWISHNFFKISYWSECHYMCSLGQGWCWRRRAWRWSWGRGWTASGRLSSSRSWPIGRTGKNYSTSKGNMSAKLWFFLFNCLAILREDTHKTKFF